MLKFQNFDIRILEYIRIFDYSPSTCI